LKQSNRKKNQENTAALYVRISREDELAGESGSITNQKKLLINAAIEKGFMHHQIFCDDGITGMSENRPQFKLMLSEIENGNITTVFVKDLSRLTRDQSVLLELTRKFFPKYDTRLISVADGTDTAEGEDELAPFRGLMNEMYARDISKKRRATNKVKGHTGEPLSLPPFGYMKDPCNSKRWLIDDEAAAIVRRIFSMTMEGQGTEQIAAELSSEKILTPMSYWHEKGLPRGGRQASREPYHWNSSTIVKILSLQEYCGDIINFKTYSKSIWLKDRIPNEEENMAIFRDVHEPIIDRAVYEKVKQKRGSTRKRKAADGEKNMFSGILVCADCGHNLWFHFNQKNHDIKYFNCSNYKGNRGTCDSTHYIRMDFLEQVVLGEIRRLTKFASKYEADFAKIVMGHSLKTSQDERTRKQRDMYTKSARIREIDKLIERLYEDNVSGKLSDERFARMTASYETEQGKLMQEVKTLATVLDRETDSAISTEDFIATVRKYTRAKKLTQRMLSELIEKIEVCNAEKISGVKTQRLVIHYNCVGNIEIPDFIPEPEVRIDTRKGVAVSYSA